MNSRPGKYVSTSTLWPKVVSNSATRWRSSERSEIFDAGVIPFPVPSAIGLANSG